MIFNKIEERMHDDTYAGRIISCLKISPGRWMISIFIFLFLFRPGNIF